MLRAPAAHGVSSNKPTLKDFRAPDFHVCFYYLQLFWQKSEFAFIILTFGSSPEVAFLNKNSCFCIKKAQKNSPVASFYYL